MVSGASSGIGLAAARRMHDLGAARDRARPPRARRWRRGSATATSTSARSTSATARRPPRRSTTTGRRARAGRGHQRQGPQRARAALARELGARSCARTSTASTNCVAAALPALRAAEGRRRDRRLGLGLVAGRLRPRLPGDEGAACSRSRAARTLEEFDARPACASRSSRPAWSTRRCSSTAPSRRRARSARVALKTEDVAEVCAFLARCRPGVHVPELTVLPTALQALGRTS